MLSLLIRFKLGGRIRIIQRPVFGFDDIKNFAAELRMVLQVLGNFGEDRHRANSFDAPVAAGEKAWPAAGAFETPASVFLRQRAISSHCSRLSPAFVLLSRWVFRIMSYISFAL